MPENTSFVLFATVTVKLMVVHRGTLLGVPVLVISSHSSVVRVVVTLFDVQPQAQVPFQGSDIVAELLNDHSQTGKYPNTWYVLVPYFGID